MSANELTGCFQPNEFIYICREEIPIYTHVPKLDCESTLLHLSTTRIPNSCEYRLLRLSKTFWMPLHMGNHWLFASPNTETFTVLCPQETTTLKLEKEGKLTLKPCCKGYSSYLTLYAISTLSTNLTNDYVPSAPTEFVCCFENSENAKFDDLPLPIPRVYAMSSADDLWIAGMKTEEVQQMIKDQEMEHNQNLYMVATSWGSALGTVCIIIACICCKCCRNGFFWLWNKWNPKDCWKQTQDKY